MLARNMGRRLAALEQCGGENLPVIMFNPKQLRHEAMIAEWEAEHGPIGDRQVFMITLVKAVPREYHH